MNETGMCQIENDTLSKNEVRESKQVSAEQTFEYEVSNPADELLLGSGPQDAAGELSHDQNEVRQMLPCPETKPDFEHLPEGWKEYEGANTLTHGGFEGIKEDKVASPESPQNECFYDEDGDLIDKSHRYSDCGGSPNQFDASQDSLKHTIEDEGGLVNNLEAMKNCAIDRSLDGISEAGGAVVDKVKSLWD